MRFALKPAAAVAVLALILTGCGGGGVPSTVTGSITSTVLSIAGGFGGQTPGDCILNLPDQGSQVLLKANGVTVATAQLGRERTFKSKLGESCWEQVTFTSVPAGKQLYEVTINDPGQYGGCTGTVYYKPAQLEKPIGLSCN